MGLEAIAIAIVSGDALLARSLVQDWLAGDPAVHAEPPPSAVDPRVRALDAGLAELFAGRLGQAAPSWAADIPPLAEPFYLVRAATTMPRFRRMCEEQSPPPLRRRHLFAPPDYLTFA